ncbi:MAG: hypothetical protein SNJ53_02660 [Thermodesulfovibrionales bacterium]
MKRFAIIVIVCLMISACGKKEVKKETEEGRIASEIIVVSEQLRQAYIARDLQTIQRHTTSTVYRQITQYINEYKVIDIEFKPVWVEIDTKGVTLNISWKGKWEKSGKNIEDRGMAIFEFTGQPPRVAKILRANPFEYR